MKQILDMAGTLIYLFNQMRQPQSAKSIANYFLAKGKVSPMKIQKLVFFAHGWHLALKGTPLIDESVEAWEYGPVVPSLYHCFKQFGNSSIAKKATIIDFSESDFSEREVPAPSEADLTSFLDKIWETYFPFSPIQLSNMTHEPNTPWSVVVEKARSENGGFLPKNTDIPNEVIANYFKCLAQDATR